MTSNTKKEGFVLIVLILLSSIASYALQDADEKTALEAISQAQLIKSELEFLGLKTNYIRDKLIEAQKEYDGQDVSKLVEQIFEIKNLTDRAKFVSALDTTFTQEEIQQLLNKENKIRYNYAKVLEQVKLIEERKNLTFLVMDQITLLDQKISELNIKEFNFTEIFEAQKQIKEKFDKEQIDEITPIIDDTSARIDQIQLETTRFRTFLKASQQNMISFVKRNKFGVTFAMLVLFILIWIAYNETIIIILKRKIEDYKTEQEVLKDLIKKAQKDYYQEGSVTKSIYEIKNQKYEEKQLQIKEQLPVLETNLEERIEGRYYLHLVRAWDAFIVFLDKILEKTKMNRKYLYARKVHKLKVFRKTEDLSEEELEKLKESLGGKLASVPRKELAKKEQLKEKPRPKIKFSLSKFKLPKINFFRRKEDLEPEELERLNKMLAKRK